MRFSPLAAALALALSGLSLDAAAATSQDQEIAALKAQVEALMARLDDLEQQSEAQSDVNIDTSQALESLATGPKVETKGGLKVTTPDKAFEFALSGRIHADAYLFNEDLAPVTNTTEFRRARLTLAGKAFGWEYKMEQDFAAGTNLDGLRDLYIAKGFANGGKLTIGHFKPYRSMEELTSSNDILMMERPFSSATGLFGGRQFQQGLGYMKVGSDYTAGISVFNLRGAAGARNEGMGAAGRITWAPVNTETKTFHLGAWASMEDAADNTPNLVASVNYAGRRGPSMTVATMPGTSGDTVTAIGLEAAGSIGSAFFQSEYARANFGQLVGPDQEVETFYVQGSWFLNGGHKPYKAGNGVFTGPKVEDKKLWELTARYDTIENKDIADRQASTWMLGLNYYINPNLRIMANYSQGDNDQSGDETSQFALRTQFAF